MILVDSRESKAVKGSPGLWEDLKKTNLPIQKERLDGGDLFFLGSGPDDTTVTVGIEFKKLRDLLSSLRSERLQGHQLHELQVYDYRFLLVEGEYKHDDNGFVTVRSGFRDWKPVPGGWRAAELDKVLLGLTLRAGVIVKETGTRRESIRWITSLYRNFTDVKWDKHTSHTGLYRPQSTLVRPSPFCNFIGGIPSIGLKRAKAVEKFFHGHPRHAIAARAETWKQIEGVGPKLAEQVDRFLEGD